MILQQTDEALVARRATTINPPTIAAIILFENQIIGRVEMGRRRVPGRCPR
jgi:hypothetical protein